MSSLKDLPLVVDLDGTLIETDVTFESIRLFTAGRFWRFVLIGCWFLKGRAYLKQELAKRVVLDYHALPYRSNLLSYLKQEHAQGRKLVLATAADQCYALGVVKYLGIFAEVYASDGKTNLRSYAKARVLVAHFGEKGFVYAGDSSKDLPVWSHAAGAMPVQTSHGVMQKLKQTGIAIVDI